MNKIALIIGNGKYPETPLNNPVNDAEAIKFKLDYTLFLPNMTLIGGLSLQRGMRMTGRGREGVRYVLR